MAIAPIATGKKCASSRKSRCDNAAGMTQTSVPHARDFFLSRAWETTEEPRVVNPSFV